MKNSMMVCFSTVFLLRVTRVQFSWQVKSLKPLKIKKNIFFQHLSFMWKENQGFHGFWSIIKYFFSFVCLFIQSNKAKFKMKKTSFLVLFCSLFLDRFFNTEGHGDCSFKPTPCLDAHLKYCKKGKIKAYYKKRIVSTGDLSSLRTSEAATLSPAIPEPALPDAFGPSRWWQWGRAPRCMVPPACHPPKDEPWVHSRCGGGIRDA